MPFDNEMLNAHFGRIWPVHVDAFTELLITLRQHFRGDLDLMLVLAVIGSRTLPSRRVQGLSYEDFAAGRTLDARVSPINLQSVAECSGIPRETVRRKVLDLEAMGWIERREGGVLTVTGRAASDLMPATEASLRYLLKVGATCVEVAAGSKRQPLQ